MSAAATEPLCSASSNPASMPSNGNTPTIQVTGRLLKIARLFDEVWLQPPALIDPAATMENLRAQSRADLFTFAQPVPETERKFSYHCELENWAVAPTHDFQAWWDSLPQESRKNTRKAQKHGITVGPVEFTDELVRGIKGLYDETPIRQGRRFWHYGKDLETVKRENATYLERSQFIGAHLEGELIGFIKIVRVGSAARIMQILAKNALYSKHPMNALLTATVEYCAKQGIPHLIYGQYIYGQKASSSVTEFKRRNSFQPMFTPRYFVPLTVKGRIALSLRLHRPVSEMLPEKVLNFLLDARSFAYTRIYSRSRRSRPTASAS